MTIKLENYCFLPFAANTFSTISKSFNWGTEKTSNKLTTQMYSFADYTFTLGQTEQVGKWDFQKEEQSVDFVGDSRVFF